MQDYRFTTQFAPKTSRDIQFYKNLLLEKYVSLHPQIQFYSLLEAKVPTDEHYISYEENKTVVDDLYGEAVPIEFATEGFVQPHTHPEMQATDPKVFSNPYTINAKVMYSAKQQNQIKQGIDVTEDTRFRFLVYQFDVKKIPYIKIGDRFVWNEFRYSINRFEPAGRWVNTNIFVYWDVYVEVIQLGA